MVGQVVTRTRVKAAAESYRHSLDQVESRRERLRQQVIAWKGAGATIVEIAAALGWSRQSVYDLIRDPAEDEKWSLRPQKRK